MSDILQEASELINGQRAQDYGPVTDNFQRIADLFAAYLGDTDTDDLGPYDVANLMILVKLARIKNAGYHRDSYADIAGYAALAEKVNDEIDTGRAISEYIATGNTEATNNVADWNAFWNDVDQSIKDLDNEPEDSE